MNFPQSIRIALRAMGANKMRAGLTMLGVIIGVGAVVTMLAIGQGARVSTQERIQALGSNLLFVFSGSVRTTGVRMGMGTTQTLNLDDAKAIGREVPEVEMTAPEFGRNGSVVFGSQNTVTQVSGVTPDYEEVRNFRAVRGRFVTNDDLTQRTRVAVLGKTVVGTLFGEEEPIGAQIKVNRSTFTVVGVMEEKGATGFSDRDDVVFIPLTTAQKRLFGVEHVRQIYVKVRDQKLMDVAQEKITLLLRQRHRIPPGGESDFTIRSQADVLGAFEGVAQTFTYLLAGIAAVSLLVGGIGIMNIMLVSVTERTREIGIRKAVGATQGDVLLQFLVEAVVLSVMGGLVGIALGTGGAVAMTKVAGWATIVSPFAVLLAFGFAVAVGVFFGLYPARRAAALDPIQALRYE